MTAMSKHQLHERIERDGSYHKAESHPGAPTAFETLRELYKLAAHATVDLCPEGRELSLALTHLIDEGLPMAIGAIARDDGNQLDPNVVDAYSRLVAKLDTLHREVSRERLDDVVAWADAKATAETTRDSNTHTTYGTPT